MGSRFQGGASEHGERMSAVSRPGSCHTGVEGRLAAIPSVPRERHACSRLAGRLWQSRAMSRQRLPGCVTVGANRYTVYRSRPAQARALTHFESWCSVTSLTRTGGCRASGCWSRPLPDVRRCIVLLAVRVAYTRWPRYQVKWC